MRVVVDANVVFAALLSPRGHTARQVERRDVRLLAPAMLAGELASHESELMAKAGCASAEWRQRVRGLLRRVELVPEARLRRFLRNSRVLRVTARDPLDAAYAATVVATRADFLWTRDAVLLDEFGPQAVRVLPTSASVP